MGVDNNNNANIRNKRIECGRKKVRVTSLCPRGICINLCGYMFTRDAYRIDDNVINHELIHTAQMKELLVIPFYIIYLVEWIIRFFIYRNWNRAYRNISFEREAYTHGNDHDYLTHRRPMSWWKYIR